MLTGTQVQQYLDGSPRQVRNYTWRYYLIAADIAKCQLMHSDGRTLLGDT
jgi:hypothetical protein